jgi:sugar/nucleoside kinase (ribokinase family)
LDGLSPQQCLERANSLGALVCQTNGDWEGLPTRQQLSEIESRSVESKR